MSDVPGPGSLLLSTSSIPGVVGWAVVLAGLALAWLGWRRVLRWCESYQGADWGRLWLNRLDGLNRAYCQKFHGLPPEPIPLPECGSVVLAANHVSGVDPMLLAAASPRPLRFVIAQEQYDRWWLRGFFDAIGVIPVNRQHRPERSFYAARKALENGQVVAIFPEGGIRKEPGPIRLKRGAVVLACLTDAPLVPVKLSGIGGRGRTLGALLVRSKARVRAGPPLNCPNGDAERIRVSLERFYASDVLRNSAKTP